MWFIHFKRNFLVLFFTWLICVFAQSLGRLFLLLYEIYQENIYFTCHDLSLLFGVGLKFDIRTASILIGMLFLIMFVAIFFSKFYQYWSKLLPFLTMFIFFITLLITSINFYYYQTYDRHIDVFIFGLIDDDTSAVIQTIWSDYPVITLLAILLGANFLFYKAIKKLQRYADIRINKNRRFPYAITSVLIATVVIFIGCRGSLDTFPLRKSNAQVSNINSINMFVPNGLIALDWAYKDYKVDNELLSSFKGDIGQVLQGFYGSKKPHDIAIFDNKTPLNLIAKNKPPHVVLSVMESMGTHLFEYDSPQNNLLGELRNHWDSDWRFSRFLAEGGGTIDSLNRFFVRSPVAKISQSSAQFANFHSNMFKPFRDNGYKVIFITAGNGAWRNLNQFLPHLGVSEFVEQNTLAKAFPEADVTTWGVPDEYMFKYAQQRLEQAEQAGEHLFIMMMSVTNHPPYRIPATHVDRQFKFTSEQVNRFTRFGAKEVDRMFNTFYYSNDQLGKFISYIKGHQLGEHTILAFTGDHNMRGIGYPDPKERVLFYAVPFYLYVPQTYQHNSYFDRDSFGSHKDIFPTLYALALSEAMFYQTGCNLLSKELDPTWCGTGYNPNIIIDSDGAYFLRDNIFRPWTEINRLRVNESQPLNQQQILKMEKWKHFSELLNWQISEQINSE